MRNLSTDLSVNEAFKKHCEAESSMPFLTLMVRLKKCAAISISLGLEWKSKLSSGKIWSNLMRKCKSDTNEQLNISKTALIILPG